MDKKNEKSKPDIISPHGGYRNLKSYQIAEEGGFTEKLYQARQRAKRK